MLRKVASELAPPCKGFFSRNSRKFLYETRTDAYKFSEKCWFLTSVDGAIYWVLQYFHLNEIKIFEITTQWNHNFRKLTSVKSKFSKFHLGEIKICEFHLGEINVCEIPPRWNQRLRIPPRWNQRLRNSTSVVAAGFKPAWRAHQVQRPESSRSALWCFWLLPLNFF